MPEKLRCFIAIDLDGPVRTLIREIQGKLSDIDPYVRWVAPDNAHITMKFLGDIAVEKISGIEESLGKAAGTHERSNFTTSVVNAIPNTRSPRILFLDIEKNATLAELFESVEKELIPLRIKSEKRKFLAHI